MKSLDLTLARAVDGQRGREAATLIAAPGEIGVKAAEVREGRSRGAGVGHLLSLLWDIWRETSLSFPPS